jgi:farnesyl diphosphate synthase
MPTLGSAFAVGGVLAAAIALTVSLRARKPIRTVKKLSELMTVEEFKEHYQVLSREIVASSQKEFELPDVSAQRVIRLLDYSVPGGKVNRGLTIVHVAEVMTPGRRLTASERREIAALGWTIEWMQASFLVADDMMDSSLTRRGAPCWYLVEGIGNAAINDALILLTQLELILDRYLSKHPHVDKMRRVLLETTYETELGQLLDLTTQPPGATEVDLSLYTIQRYKQIVKYKTAFYSFVAPVILGLLYAGVTDKTVHDKVREICLIMGEYFQIQDDVLDCYGEPAVIGKIGTDIEDAKCSWLVVQALDRATDAQKAVLKADYGKKKPECVSRVKSIFRDLNLQSIFNEYEENVVRQIKGKIAELRDPLIESICDGLLRKIYKREK